MSLMIHMRLNALREVLHNDQTHFRKLQQKHETENPFSNIADQYKIAADALEACDVQLTSAICSLTKGYQNHEQRN